MTPSFFSAPHSGSAVHALVIGVGGYPYLAGGEKAAASAEADFPGMGQLTSPPRSALAFARRFTDGCGRWDVPLGSVDLLVSVRTGDPFPEASGLVLPTATIDDIRTAFEAWLARCSQHDDNIAVLYFCGHGLQSESQVLLASDFNRFSSSPFAQAFDFDVTRLALQQRGPRSQCIVIDACRTDCLDQGPVRALPLAQPEPFDPLKCENELILRPPPFLEATGPHGDVSHLTRALLRALDGQAATTDDDGAWVIRTAGVHQAIDLLLREELGVLSLAGGVDAHSRGDTLLLRLEAAPVTRLTVNCRPAEEASRSTLSCVPAYPPDLPGVECGLPRHSKGDDGRAPSQEWRMELQAGYYLLSAQSETAKGSLLKRVDPPHSRAILQVMP
ncbi:caspase family protein [Streptomyces sp. NPDC096339]|uniref:caspase family protein n=1 Tax=Streptomyces sp. NPDC096339 TaxID=3366086 RepID=UPI0038195DAB